MALDLADYRTPGQLIRALLDERGWTQTLMAEVLGISQSVANRWVSDIRPIDAEAALLLAEVFNVPAEWFLGLQQSYDLAMAKIVVQADPRRAARAQLLSSLPVAEMIERGWLRIADTKNVKAMEAALAEFFGVAAIEEIEVLPHAAKRTNVGADVTPAQLAWLYRVRQVASGMFTPAYSRSKTREALKDLQSLLMSPEEARRVPRILHECGIRFVLVESLGAAKIDGVCFWLDNQAPVIGLSMRYDRIDNFWFVLRHEIEHVLQSHGRGAGAVSLDAELEGDRAGIGPTVDEDERVANHAAAEFCVPAKQLDGFVARKAPMFHTRDIIGFARTLNIHPGLVAGQLQRRLGQYERFRNHLVKIRYAVAPSALVDGWGDIAPVTSHGV